MTRAIPVPVAVGLPLSVGLPSTLVTGRSNHSGAARTAVAALVSHPARWLVGMIAATTAVSVAATAASPYLLDRHPLVLMCLSPRMAFLAVAADRTALIPFVLLGTARLVLTDPIHFLLGQRLGLVGDRPGRVDRLSQARDRV